MAEGGGEILEGFLCPICKVDLGTAVQLHAHFQEHTEDQDVLKSLKDLLGKAKKKILKLDEEIFSTECEEQARASSASHLMSSYNPVNFEPQEIGATRNYTSSFRALRNSRMERYAAETNKLLIRLDKLLVDLPTDPVKRKAYEQAVVPWIDDRDVKLCPTCAKHFHVARRKHHCRLCGAIMCHDCTQFLPLSLAKKMTNPAFGHQESGSTRISIAASFSPGAVSLPTPNLGLLRRSNSSTSLNSVLSLVDTITGEQHFRLCIHCKQLLDTHEKLKESRTLKPIISQFYERLRSYQMEADQLAVMYNNMCQSLNCGESTYNLMNAQVVRVKLLKLAESIDSLSNKIAILGTKDVENPPRGKSLQLQHMIRTAATSYLREQLVALPTLPTEAQLKALQNQRRQEVSARIQQEKQLAALEAHQAEMQRKRDSPQRKDIHRSSSPGQHKSADQVMSDTGWGPEAAQMFDSEDPMIQQMNIIRNYIKQARAAHKYDEVATLEQNLKELKEEYWRQQQVCDEP
ncbi:rabenosyn-5 [Zootermopsis nevadensis]|uniref:Rabenosyn-5 n=1 Tax=Zootermopsis nevadensis TaxID=136037 RepID=A0A067R220_ZOONE|nr:rabenosyn-5 [Zootermopsis nevadensis]XP_021926300.1 rabenosyn-5 [Zootermopsis nevadensis]KDR16038.1 Rabenosyn-5 [Zootermopsis nevadensis]